MQKFLVLKDEDGTFRPLAFISPLNEASKMRAQDYYKKLDAGQKIVVAEMQFIENYAAY